MGQPPCLAGVLEKHVEIYLKQAGLFVIPLPVDRPSLVSCKNIFFSLLFSRMNSLYFVL